MLRKDIFRTSHYTLNKIELVREVRVATLARGRNGDWTRAQDRVNSVFTQIQYICWQYGCKYQIDTKN